MEITGIVTTGLGKAAYFLGQDFYKNQFREKCGFTPFAGTLNLIVEEDCTNIIKPDQGFGAVRYIKAYLNKDIVGAIVFPDKTTHDENYLEFISKDKLRDKYNFKDGDEVLITIDI